MNIHSFVALCHAVCAEAFNPDEDEEGKEPWVNYVSYHKDHILILRLTFPNSVICSSESELNSQHDIQYHLYELECLGYRKGLITRLCFNFQVTHPKTDEQRQRLQEACRGILLFKNLDPVSGLFHKPSVLLWIVFCHLLNYSKENMA